MNMLLLIASLFIKLIYAGVMGTQSDDDIYFYFSIIAFLGLILGILYLIKFLKNKLKNKNSMRA